MPVVQKKFSHDYSSIPKYTLYTYTAKKVNGTENNQACCKEITMDFYTELKDTLREINADDFIFNDTTYSFTVWGRKYDVACYFYSSNANNITISNNNAPNVIAPFIYSQNTITAIKCFRWMGTTTASLTSALLISYTNAGASANTNMFTSAMDKSRTTYTLKIYSNTNFYCIQYISSFGEVINLLTIIKGNVTDKPEINVVYECPSPNNNYFDSNDLQYYFQNLSQGVIYGTVQNPNNTNTWNCGYHQIYRMDNQTPILGLPSTSGMAGGSNNLAFFGLQHIDMSLAKSNIEELYDGSDAVITDVVCLGGLITFDNMLLADNSLNLNSFYTINGNIYYCVGDDIGKENESTFDRSLMYPRFLLKM